MAEEWPGAMVLFVEAEVGGMVLIDRVAGGTATTEVAGEMAEGPGEMAMAKQ